MRTNLKFIGAILFTMLFFVGGFFMNTTKGEAASTVSSFGVSYSLSSVISNTNTDGSISTMVFVGCAPKSGDLFDVNTGKPCNNNVKTVLVGCAASSGDLFDVNTGIRCSSYIKPILFGCALRSGDAYDINTGKHCGTTLTTTLPKTSTTAKATPTTTKTTVTSKALEISPIASDTIDTILTDEGQDELSGREKLKDSFTASVAKVGSIVTGPMSIWIILLIILILLGGGYGIYSFGFLKKNKTLKGKDEVKKVVAEPAVKHSPATPANPVNTPINTDKLPNTNTPQ